METNELIRALRNLAETSRFAHDEGILMMAADRLEELGTAPVAHGAWKEDRTDIMCTACNERFSDGIVFASLRHWDGEMWMKYCPYCGAKMDLEG